VQVILLKDVDKVGLRGEVVDVARGYARNYLLPRKLAETATPGALEDLRRRDEVRARQEARTHDEARDIAARLEQTVLRFDVKAGPTGSLFGSVTATDIADRLWDEHKIRIDRRKVELGDSIKRVGRHEVPVEVFTDVEAALRLEVVPEGGDLAQMEALEAAALAEEEAAAAAAVEAAAAAEPEGAVEEEAWIEQVEALEEAEAETAEAAAEEGEAEPGEVAPSEEASAEPAEEESPSAQQ
jgi:large subunit ribosomal protein L9